MASMVKEYTAMALAPLLDRLTAMEERLNTPPPPPIIPEIDGRLADFEERVRSAISRLDAMEPAKGDIGEPGRDGVGIAGALIDRDGNLVVTLSNGEHRSLGCVIGKDGAPGKDGLDGLGVEDMSVGYDGERTISFMFARGELVKEFAVEFPIVLDRGVYTPGTEYRAGDCVTYGGSQWIAQRPTTNPPETHVSKDWRLQVRAGRDGKNGKDGPRGPQGPEGPAYSGPTRNEFTGGA